MSTDCIIESASFSAFDVVRCDIKGEANQGSLVTRFLG